MTRILLLFGTTDGHTAKVARFIGDMLRTGGASVDVVYASVGNPDPSDYDGVIVAASIHSGGYQRAVTRWVRRHAKDLARIPSSFVSVCLGVLQKDVTVRRELEAIVTQFEEATGWKPGMVKLLAGAVPYTRYGWLKRRIMQRIVGKAGGSTDISRDHEYTDWDDLRSFVVAFHAVCRVTARHEAADEPAARLSAVG